MEQVVSNGAMRCAASDRGDSSPHQPVGEGGIGLAPTARFNRITTSIIYRLCVGYIGFANRPIYLYASHVADI